METTYRILIVEDVPTDAELTEREIRKVLKPSVFETVETEEDFLGALKEFAPDIIVSDYLLPSFDGMTALKLTLDRTPLTPFIIVTGSMNEETAVDCMKAGATNYVIKQHLRRLGPAVLHALEEKKIRVQRLETEAALKESEERFRTLVESAPEAIFVQSRGRFVYLNPAMLKLVGASAPEQLIGRDFMGRMAAEYHEVIRKRIRAQLETGKPAPLMEQEYVRLDGSRVPVETTAVAIRFQGHDAHLVFVRDITERRKAEQKLQYLAYYDPLTDIPNRNLFIERLEKEIAAAEAASRTVGVSITDIDRFKSINDAYGTGVGDKVLNEVARRLSAAIRNEDTPARLGNDEFGTLWISSADDDVILPQKIVKEISYPLKIDGHEIGLTFSTGISLFPKDGRNARDLLKSAGLALAAAKKEGRGACEFYNEDMNVRSTEFITLERNLLKALARDEFTLHYQPYRDMNTGKMLGMEALVRWRSKDQGMVSPAEFIPVLEETGQIMEVGKWILRSAVRQVREWQNNGYPVVPVSVNLSLIQFRQKDLVEMIRKIIGEFGFYPSLLTLEITESAFMQDIEFTSWVLNELKKIGVSMSIDDFGTGYSSLSYLKRFPIDNLKIDISFIREIVKDPDSASIVMAIINMAHTLQLKTIAEGIETEEQWKFLRLLRCDMGQGFYFSKPLPAAEVEKMLKQELDGH